MDSTHSSPLGYLALFSSPLLDQGHHGHDIPVIPLQLTSPLQVVAVKLFSGRFYTFCSLYLPLERLYQDVILMTLCGSFPFLSSSSGILTAVTLCGVKVLVILAAF